MKISSDNIVRTVRNTALASTIALFSLSASAANDFAGASKDAWLTGKVETVFMLNSHLNAFEIDTDVESGVVKLSGTVESDIDKDLAASLAKGVSGVVEVNNELMVDAELERNSEAEDVDGDRRFGTWVDDATTTAAVKSRLIGNEHIKGLKIDVDTRGDVVTLTGRVETDQQKMLAEELASNTGDVKGVRNNLVVDPE